ncbi:MAG: hypothetical protein JW870_02320 [Candidatus Delongbacteria bacterium]|nr:hypothetical protein [Candidatus Delongbacteria bacterium]
MFIKTAGLRFPSDYDEKWVTFQVDQWIGKVNEIIAGLDELLVKNSTNQM